MRLIFALRCFSYEYSSGQHTILRFTPFLRFDSCVIILRCDVKIQSGAKDYYSLIRDSCFTLGRENPGKHRYRCQVLCHSVRITLQI